MINENPFSIEEMISYADRLESIVVADKKYWKIPGDIGDLGIHIAWDGSLFNARTRRCRKWSAHTAVSKGTIPNRTAWLITITGRQYEANCSIAKARAMAEVFVPKPQTTVRYSATMLIKDDQHQARPTDVVWTISVSVKSAKKIKLINLNDSEDVKFFPTITAAILHIHPTIAQNTMRKIALSIQRGLCDRKRGKIAKPLHRFGYEIMEHVQ